MNISSQPPNFFFGACKTHRNAEANIWPEKQTAVRGVLEYFQCLHVNSYTMIHSLSGGVTNRLAMCKNCSRKFAL